MAALSKLLIVDDEAAQMKALCQTLEFEGYDVTGFTSATQAVAALREQVFDLVLSDLMMPEMDGITLMQVAHEIDPTVVGIVMTGHGTIDTAVQAMKHGAHDYILKPFKLSAILPVLSRALAVRRLRLENIQLHQVVGIYELSVAIALASDSGTVLQKIADAAIRLMEAKHLFVLLPANNGEELRIAVARGEGADQFQGARVPFDHGLAQWVQESRESLSRQGEPDDSVPPVDASLPGLPSGISIPMLAGGKLTGILHFCPERAHSVGAPGQIKALNILASTAASALEGSSLVEDLRAAEQRYRRLSENAPDIVSRYELHPRRRFVYVSPVVAAITGYSPEEYYADPDLSLRIVHQDDRPQLESVLRGDHPSGNSLTLRWLHRNGQVIWIEQKNVLVYDSHGRLAAIEGIARDITARRKLEEQFQQAQRLEGVGRLAGGVAHDFNNLLTVIKGFTQMALDDLPSEHFVRENLVEVRMAAERAEALTQQLLAFSRKQLISPSVLNINTTVVQLGKMLHRLIGEDIDVRTNLVPHLGNVLADSGQIQQVLMNLAINSRDAMPDGGTLYIETSNINLDETHVLDHPDARHGRHVLLTVRDSGTGITPEVLGRLFEPFFTTKPQGVGTGLGLATAYGIIKQAGGWISVESEVGHGSTFKVYLPRIDKPVVEVGAANTTDPHGTETILIVEDQADLRKFAVMILKRLGYHVQSAGTPEEALVLAQSSSDPIHLLLTDVVMPGMTGRQLASEIQGLRPGLPVLFMSGYTDDVIAHQGVLDPGVAFLGKPFTANSLGEKVRETLGRRAPSTTRGTAGR